MAVRKPLYINKGNIEVMTTAMVTEIVHQTCYQYATAPSVIVEVSGSEQTPTSHFPSINDTRYKSGAVSSTDSAFPDEGTTEEPQLVTISWNRLVMTHNSYYGTPNPPSDDGKKFPLYYNSDGNIQAMNLQDVKDTFIHPAIDLLTVAGTPGDTAGGTYIITTSNVPAAGFSVVSSTRKVFSDTKANIPGYTTGEIGASGSYQDDNTEENAYFLHRKDPPASPSYTDPLYVTDADDLQTFSSVTFKSLLYEWIRHTAYASTDGYQIQYNINGSGNLRTNILNKALTGVTGDYQTNQDGDDYRAQEWPNGTLDTINTYTFNITKG